MRHHQRPDKKYLAASVVVHVVAVAVAWMAQVSEPQPLDLLTYEINLVSPPSTREAEVPAPAPEEEVVVETPEPVVEEEPPPVIEETREERRPTPTPTPTPTPPVEPPGDPDPSEEVGGEDLNVRMEGLQRNYPAYYNNIILQIRRCMDYRGGGRFETTVFFHINRDGSIDKSTLRFVERSGNLTFDFAAMGAVECAGGRFGALPQEMGMDRIPVVFTFRPGGLGDR